MAKTHSVSPNNTVSQKIISRLYRKLKSVVFVQKVSGLHASPVSFGSDGAKLGLEVEIPVKSGSEESSKV